jgi:hypothetical protein
MAREGEVGQGPGRMTRAKNKSLQDEALWQVYQLNAKTIVMLLALGGLMIWAAWL